MVTVLRCVRLELLPYSLWQALRRAQRRLAAPAIATPHITHQTVASPATRSTPPLLVELEPPSSPLLASSYCAVPEIRALLP